MQVRRPWATAHLDLNAQAVIVVVGIVATQRGAQKDALPAGQLHMVTVGHAHQAINEWTMLV